MKRKFYAAALLAAALSSPCPAQADESMEIDVVTPTRTAQAAGKAIADTTVITADDIRKEHAPDVPTLLRNVAGVEISQPGGIGKPASVYMRGTNSDQVLVLVDGVRINSATTGTTAIDQLMTDQIDHIEVVRGNVSSLYGSEAIGGVIQIFTKHGHGAPAFNASAGVGSLGTRRAAAGVGGAEGGTDFNVQVSTFRTDGVSALNPALVPTANPDRDGYRNNSISANVGHAFSADHRISASLFGSNGNNQYDSAFGLPTDVNTNKEQMWKLSLASDDQINDTWHSKLQVATGVDQYRDYLNGAPTVLFGTPSSLFQTASTQLGWQNTLHVSDHNQLLLGAESLRQHVSTDITPGYLANARTVNSFYAGYTGRFDAHQLQANVRQDRNSQYGTANTGLLGYGYAFSDAWRATTSYSTAFKAPTFNDLYYPNYGNPALRPEYSHNVEAGLHYAAQGQHVDFVVFHNRIDDLISPNAAGTSAVNINRARIRGAELMYAGQFGDTGLKGALTSQSARDATSNQPLVRRARLYGNLGVTQQVGAWQLGGEWQYSASRYDNFTDPVTFATSSEVLPGYNVFNLSAACAVSKSTTVQLRGDNLTNRNDSNAYGYNPLGRRFFVSVNYQQ
jgi:vitamin B12 transporter